MHLSRFHLPRLSRYRSSTTASLLAVHLLAQAVSAAQLLELEPNLNPGLSQTATHARLFPLEGWCDPVQATERFLAEAQRHGAEVLFEQQVRVTNRAALHCTVLLCTVLYCTEVHPYTTGLAFAQQSASDGSHNVCSLRAARLS